MSNFKNQFTKYDNSLKKEAMQYHALLGKTEKVVEHPTRKGFCYARMADNLSELIVVFNDKVSQVWNMPILIERRGITWHVVGRDIQRYQDWGTSAPFLPKHHSQHEFNRDEGTGADAVFIWPDQIMPLLVYPSGTAGAGNLQIAPYVLQRETDFIYVGGTGTTDLLIYKPTDGNAIMGLVYLDKSTGNPGVLIASGTPFLNSLTGTASLLQYAPYPETINQEPLYFFRLVSGTSSLTWSNLYNARQFIGGGSGGTGSSGGGGTSVHNDLTGLQGGSTGSYFHLTQDQWVNVISGTFSTGTSSLPIFTSGSIPFSDGNGILTEDNSRFSWRTGTTSLWIGEIPPPVIQIGTVQQAITSPTINGTSTSAIAVYGTGTLGSPSATFSGYRSRGTLLNPTIVKGGDAIQSIIGAAFNGSNWKNATRIRAYVDGDWVANSHEPSRLEFEVTPSGSATRRVAATIYGDNLNLPTGTFNIGGTPHNHLALLTSAPTVEIWGKTFALDTLTNNFYVWNGSSWVAISGGSTPPTGTTTSFLLLEDGTSFLLLESGDKLENG